MNEKVPGKIGITPTLLDPARAIARRLVNNEVVMIDEYPAFGVCEKGDLPDDAVHVFEFQEADRRFVLFEIGLS